MASVDFKVIKSKKIDETTELKVSRNEALARLSVEFFTEITETNKKLRIQKSFPDTFEGRKDAEKFQKSIKSASDIKAYFKIKE